MSYFNRIKQDVIADTNNSSTSNLAGSSTFTGTATSTLGVVGIQVSLKTDQNCMVYVDQSPDGVNWDLIDTYNYNHLIGNFGITVQAISSYVRVRVTNLSSSATTIFRLQTALCPIVESVPRSLTARGNFSVAISELRDQFGFYGSFTPLRDLKTIEPYRLVGSVFSTSNDPQFWTLSNSGTASAATINVIATLTSGTSNNGYGQITSVRSGRFVFANPNQFRCLARVTNTTVSGCSRRWGAFTVSTTTPQNGFYFELSGTGNLSVNCVAGGVITSVASGSFNGDINSYTMDTNVHAYEIIYLLANVYFYIDNVLVHTFTPTTSMISNTFTLPCTATSVNSGTGTTSGVIEVWALTILRLGKEQTESKYTHISTATTTVLKIGSGTLHSIIANNPTNNNITIYDNTAGSGTIIGIINPGSSAVPFQLSYNTPFFTGLTIVTAGSPDLTVTYE